MSKIHACKSTKKPFDASSPQWLKATCQHCHGIFTRGYSGPAPTFGGVGCRVAAHRKSGKAAATKVLKAKLKRKALR